MCNIFLWKLMRMCLEGLLNKKNRLFCVTLNTKFRMNIFKMKKCEQSKFHTRETIKSDMNNIKTRLITQKKEPKEITKTDRN